MVDHEAKPLPASAHDLRAVRVFAELEDRELEEVFASVVPRRFKAGETVFMERRYSKAIGIVWAGSGQMSFSRPPQRAVALGSLRPGTVFGFVPQVTNLRLGAAQRIKCKTDMVILDLDAAAFKELFRKMPNFAEAMFREASVHLADFGFRFYEASALSSKERLQAELLRLAREAKWHGQVAVIDPAPTHQELAELVGCAREVVTRGLKQLAQEGVIRTDKRVLEITDVAELLARDTKATGRVMFRLEADGPEFRSGARREG